MECCNNNCRQGRDCPYRGESVKSVPLGIVIVGLIGMAIYVASQIT